jgi:hypothetical protein
LIEGDDPLIAQILDGDLLALGQGIERGDRQIMPLVGDREEPERADVFDRDLWN